MSSVHILLIRDSQHKSKDDSIKVFPVGNTMHVKHIDRETRNKSTVETSLVLTNTGLDCYIDTLLQLFISDEQPFEKIQIAFPGFPMILATAESLTDELRESIHNAAAIVCESWFSECACNPFANDDYEY